MLDRQTDKGRLWNPGYDNNTIIQDCPGKEQLQNRHKWAAHADFSIAGE